MLLSIVSGTWNRLNNLQAMLESVRRQIPRHIDYEFVIVDGGSTDGTLEWLQHQPNAHLIPQGKLNGAIPAFCDGARAAQGEYVIMANDDITFWDYSIMRALAYLEDNPLCGAVAFADNRQEVSKPNVKAHMVASMPALTATGEGTYVPYAQVGMFRRWLGDHVGWWGDTDNYMSKARTYGGDNFLSARIWEMGYSVDDVKGCAIDDYITEDVLRNNNRNRASQDSQQYYGRFPRGPVLTPYPTLPNPQKQRLRVLVCPIHEPRLPAREAQEYGIAEALARVGLTWEIDYVNEPYDLVKTVEAWQPHVLILQMHDTSHFNADVIKRARAAAPYMAVINWNGDAHEKGLISPDILEALQHVDLQTVINTAVYPTYEQHGINAAYWQIGYKDPATPYQGNVPAHDVLFLGNCYNTERQQLVAALKAIQNINLGLYGSCPGSLGNTHYDFAQSQALYQHCQIAIGDTFPHTRAFVSNRLFQALSAGVFFLQEYSEDLDQETGLIAGEHYIAWHDLADLQRLIKHWLDGRRRNTRDKIAQAGMEFVRANFSYDAQVKKLWTLL